MQAIIDKINILLYNKLYNKLANLNVILLFKSIKLSISTKRTILILKNIKRVESKKIVDLIARKLQKAIDNFMLLAIYKKRIIARTTNIEYYSLKNFTLNLFDNNKNNCICFSKKKKILTNFLTSKSFTISTTSFKKKEFISKIKFSNFSITSKNKLIQQIRATILLSCFILFCVLSTIK